MAFVLGILVLLFVLCFWLVRAFELVQVYRRVPLIRAGGDMTVPRDSPLISVIIPAHNEEAMIGQCLQSVLDQDYPRFEVILVDDRSRDGTVDIARSMFDGRSNCKVITVADLPPGWTGKCHALDKGVKHACGEWLAFLDADSSLDRSALGKCYREALERQASMITLSPQFVVKTFWEKVIQPACASMVCMLFPLGKVNDPASPVASANGMFYMISRPAYEQIGGHRDVKSLAVEDIGIGKRVKALGLGLVFANGREVLRTRMYTGFLEIVNGWTRILSASMNYRISTVVKWLIVHVLGSGPVFAAALWGYVPAAMDIWPSAWLVLPTLCLILMTVVSWLFYLQLGVPSRYSILLILGQLMLVVVFSVIVKKILCKDALQWRGTTYDTNLYQPTRLDPVSPARYQSPSSSTALDPAN